MFHFSNYLGTVKTPKCLLQKTKKNTDIMSDRKVLIIKFKTRFYLVGNSSVFRRFSNKSRRKYNEVYNFITKHFEFYEAHDTGRKLVMRRYSRIRAPYTEGQLRSALKCFDYKTWSKLAHDYCPRAFKNFRDFLDILSEELPFSRVLATMRFDLGQYARQVSEMEQDFSEEDGMPDLVPANQ